MLEILFLLHEICARCTLRVTYYQISELKLVLTGSMSFKDENYRFFGYQKRLLLWKGEQLGKEMGKG